MSQPERPERPGRTKPVPAADAAIDPVEFRPAAPAAESTAPPATTITRPPARTPHPTPVRTGPKPTVQLGVSVSPEIEQLVRAARERTGLSRRAIVEKAITDTWG